jgi:2'-hydroxyisoflavone reductase
MRLLVLGGTRFLGRHVVEAALAHGHDVSIFTRGRIAVPWAAGVRHLAGDRDPAAAPGLAALATGDWDAMVDLSGYVPRCVRASARLLAERAAHCVFVSSVSVYAEPVAPGIDEAAPVSELADAANEDVATYYGALKAACEREVAAAFGADRAAIVRPGLIVGPHDPTDRFGYWVARFALPELQGDRGDDVVVPAPADRPLQFVDARDLAAWIVALAERRVAGTFNACSEAGGRTMGSLIDALVEAAARSGRTPRPVWIGDDALVAAGVEPWTGLPLWIPRTETALAGFMSIDCRRAHAAGLGERPLAATIDDTASWLAARDNAAAWQRALTAVQERALVATSSPPAF